MNYVLPNTRPAEFPGQTHTSTSSVHEIPRLITLLFGLSIFPSTILLFHCFLRQVLRLMWQRSKKSGSRNSTPEYFVFCFPRKSAILGEYVCKRQKIVPKFSIGTFRKIGAINSNKYLCRAMCMYRHHIIADWASTGSVANPARVN